MTHDNSQPAEYNQFSESTRTTFEAITHALMTTQLTDTSGNSLAIRWTWKSIETINGRFRIRAGTCNSASMSCSDLTPYRS